MSRAEHFERNIIHEGLRKSKIIKGTDYFAVESEAKYLLQEWDHEWKNIQNALNETNKAQQELAEISNILITGLNMTNTPPLWGKFINNDTFKITRPSRPQLEDFPDEPNRSSDKYEPKIGFKEWIFSAARKTADNLAEKRFNNDHHEWECNVNNIKIKNKNIEDKYQNNLTAWKSKKDKFDADKKTQNDITAELKNLYSAGNADAISDYSRRVLSLSKYPDYFPRNFDVGYNPDSRILVLEYELPIPENMPTLKEVKYIVSKDEVKRSYISEAEKKRMYDSAIYQICLRTLSELFTADEIEIIDAIAFNGHVNSVDKSTGQKINPCIVSIVATKNDFMNINLSNVEPKECFKKLKGVASSTLYNITPIAPVIKFDKNDKRIIEAREIMNGIDNSINLAAMDWQDFEHLIREIFSEEFSSNNGEVKVTRSSRDEGVDAIAFDPDPIRGGKIVIQAKRYTNTVGVSAVRDLYGTVLNEGATKGILITTADYGPESYDFAKDKPITLMNGNNLLYLLEKHGTKAKIDITEAKKLLAN